MRDAIALQPSRDGLQRTGLQCQCCGRVVVLAVAGLFTNNPRGSSRRFCSPACRQAAYRRRRALAAEDTPAQHHGGRARKLNPERAPSGAKANSHPGAKSG